VQKAEGEFDSEQVDLRSIKGRYDDLVFVVKRL